MDGQNNELNNNMAGFQPPAEPMAQPTGPMGQPVEQPAPQPTVQLVPQPVVPVEQPAPQPTAPVEQPVAQPVEQPEAQPETQLADQIVARSMEQSEAQPMAQPAEQPQNTKKMSPIVLVVCGLVVIALIIAGIFLLPKLFGGSSSGGGSGGGGNYTANKITYGSVESFCEKHGYKNYDISSNHLLASAKEAIVCTKDNGYIQVAYAQFSGPAEDQDAVKEVFQDSRIKTNGVEIINENGHKEYITTAESLITYIIMDGETFFYAISYSTDDFEDILNEIRGESALNSKYKEMVNSSGSKDNSDDESSSSTQANAEKKISEDDVPAGGDAESLNLVRKKILGKTLSKLLEYRKNTGSFPQPDAWKGKASFEGDDNCRSSETACLFVRDYMNYASYSTGDTDSQFIDPDGEPMSVLITENWATNERITLIKFNEYSTLVENEYGYTIGGTAPYSQHVVYIIPGAGCDASIAIRSVEGNVAVLYRLTDETYCLSL